MSEKYEKPINAAAVLKTAKKMPLDETMYDLAEFYKTFGDSTRTKLLTAISFAELCVSDLSALLKMTKSAVSHQLRILRHNKLIKGRRDGREVYYSLSDSHVQDILNCGYEHISERG